MDESNIPIGNKTYGRRGPTSPEIEAGMSNIFRGQDFLTFTEIQEINAKALPQQLEHNVREGEGFPGDQQDKVDNQHQCEAKIVSEEVNKRLQDTDSLDYSSIKKEAFLEKIELKYKSAKTSAKELLTGKGFIGTNDETQNERTAQKKSRNIFRRKKKYTPQTKQDFETSKKKKKFYTEVQDSTDSISEGCSSKNSNTTKSIEMPLKRKSLNIFRQQKKYNLQPKQNIELSEKKKKFFSEFQDFTDSSSGGSSSKNSETKSIEMPLKSKLSNIFTKKKIYTLKPKQNIDISEAKKNFKDSLSEKSSSEDKKLETNKKPLKEKNPKIFRKKAKYIFPMDNTIEISNEKKEIINELQNFTDSMSEESSKANTKPKTVAPVKKLKNPISLNKAQLPSATAAQKKDLRKYLITSASSSIRPTSSKATDVRSEKDVLEHFRQHLRSNKNSFDRIMADCSNKEKIDAFPESKNQVTKCSTVTQESIKITQKQSDTIKKIGNAEKQRIIENEDYEHIRKWLIQQIKDKEVVLKFRLMEGKHSKDAETMAKCIENAKILQSKIDKLFDTLVDQDRLESIPKDIKGFWKSDSEKQLEKSHTESIVDSSSSRTKRIKYPDYQEECIYTYRKLFKYLYKPLSSRSENEKILKKINPISFISEYNGYMETKKNRDIEGQKLKYHAKSIVEDFCQSLKLCRLKVKSPISLPGTGTLADFQNCIIELRKALEENLECLSILIPLATSVVFPLMSYLSLSRTKVVDIYEYLHEKRPYLFFESTNENEIFFDTFCQHHFKHSY